MLTKDILYFVFYLVISTRAMDDPIMLTISPTEVVNTFKSVVTSTYLRQLANEFAKKAADYLIQQMQNKENLITRVETNRVQHRIPILEDHIHDHKHQGLATLDEAEAMTLIKAPSPDGDNLDREFAYLSDERISAEDTSKKLGIPVIGVTKINGVYFRRLLGVL